MGSEVSSVRRGTLSVMRGINERVPGQGLPGKFTKSVEILSVRDTTCGVAVLWLCIYVHVHVYASILSYSYICTCTYM